MMTQLTLIDPVSRLLEKKDFEKLNLFLKEYNHNGLHLTYPFFVAKYHNKIQQCWVFKEREYYIQRYNKSPQIQLFHEPSGELESFLLQKQPRSITIIRACFESHYPLLKTEEQYFVALNELEPPIGSSLKNYRNMVTRFKNLYSAQGVKGGLYSEKFKADCHSLIDEWSQTTGHRGRIYHEILDQFREIRDFGVIVWNPRRSKIIGCLILSTSPNTPETCHALLWIHDYNYSGAHEYLFHLAIQEALIRGYKWANLGVALGSLKDYKHKYMGKQGYIVPLKYYQLYKAKSSHDSEDTLSDEE